MRKWKFWFTVLALLGSSQTVPAAVSVESVDEAVAALDSPEPEVRRAAVAWLGREGQAADAAVLLEALRDEDAEIREQAQGGLWRMWARSGDTEIDALLRAGIQDMGEGHTAKALEAFTRIIERRPDFAEGWNKRATAYFLMGDLDQSERDALETLTRNPAHFGALSGMGLVEVRRGQFERALDYFERALEVNPNMEGVRQSIDLIHHRLGQSGRHAT